LVCKLFLNSYSLSAVVSGKDPCIEFVAVSLKTFDVFGIVIQGVVLPTTPHDALPFEGQSAEGGMATFTAL
jgi:hypothetical protein